MSATRYACPVTTKSSSVTASPARALRSSLRLSVPMAVIGSVLVAAPSMADTPAGWPEPTDGGSFLDHFLLIAVYPLAIALVIALIVYVPALLGKDKAQTAGPVDGEWLGGPGGAKAAAQEDTDASQAGGASGKW